MCIAALAATGVLSANASSTGPLPGTSPAALLAAVRQSDVPGFSGTVVSRLSLGLPELPDIGSAGDGSSLTSMLSGSHTLQVWYGGPTEQRIALLGSTDETDLFRSGRNLWQWSSADRTAVHTKLPVTHGHHSGPAALPSGAGSLTPEAMARRALAALDPSTKVTVRGDQEVANRSAYELVLTPRATTTKIGSVRIEVDGKTKVPLGVEVYPRGSSSPAIDVSFTSVRFAAQPKRNFEFSPPHGATVHHAGPAREHGVAAPPAGVRAKPERTGSGWSTVLGLDLGKRAVGRFEKGPIRQALSPVAGSWGTGRLLDSALVSVLVTDDGHVFAGAVEPAQLYAAAGAK